MVSRGEIVRHVGHISAFVPFDLYYSLAVHIPCALITLVLAASLLYELSP
jgi:hypothetical protein